MKRPQRIACGNSPVATPTVPIPAFAVGQEVPPDQGMRRWHEWAPFSYPFNLTQQPAASLPCGMTTDGLPIGVQLVADQYADTSLLNACQSLEGQLTSQWPTLL
ncbi:amidase family protein [Spiribacter onubensis]|uniref:amidase family protein n=1 Tax=Spiribacter onubensis TaxID=3122420 RepID=UPI00349F14FB